MARIARAVAPGIPHHMIHQGNRRQQTFFKDEDFQAYLKCMPEWYAKFSVQIRAYYPMPNHVQPIASKTMPKGESYVRCPRNLDGNPKGIKKIKWIFKKFSELDGMK